MSPLPLLLAVLLMLLLLGGGQSHHQLAPIWTLEGSALLANISNPSAFIGLP